MKHRLVVLCVVMVAISAMAQTPASPSGQFTSNRITVTPRPNDFDVYCSGFITNAAIGHSNEVLAGWQGPDAVRFADRDYIYLSGSGLEEGKEYAIVREVRDPNHYEAFPGQYKAIKTLGSPYADIGRVKVLSHRDKVTVAQVTMSCEPIAPGDVAVAFVERPRPVYRPTYPFDRFAPPTGKQTGRVVLTRDFDTMFGTTRKVYLDIGADKGVQVGDYYRVVRSGKEIADTPIESVSADATMAEDTQAHPMRYNPKAQLRDLPRKNLGDMMILNVYPKSAVAIVTFAYEDMHVGDHVEQEDVPPVVPPPPPPAPKAPTISCAAQPTSVQAGETSTITCNAVSPDERQMTLAFQADRGQVSANGNYGMLDTRNVGPGPIRVMATATDDRNMAASTSTTVTVMAPPPPPSPSKASELVFKPKSAYVDNKAKALLDDLALRMQREGDAKVVVMGHSDMSTPAGSRLANSRATNVKGYLARDKGVDEQRITTRTSAGGDTAEIWWVPAGAQPPQ
jgi:outer membrane protein OmpA-like peptidoglycan-associated protein